jgi:hypothetical protein
MTDNDQRNAPNGSEPDRIDLVSDASLTEWAKKLAVTEDQLKEAVSKVGDRATDVEMHLKGSRSTTNKERVKEVGGD